MKVEADPATETLTGTRICYGLVMAHTHFFLGQQRAVDGYKKRQKATLRRDASRGVRGIIRSGTTHNKIQYSSVPAAQKDTVSKAQRITPYLTVFSMVQISTTRYITLSECHSSSTHQITKEQQDEAGGAFLKSVSL